MSTWIRVRVREVSVLAHGRGLSPFHVKPCRRPAARIAAARRILSAYAWSSSVHVSLHTRVGAPGHSRAQLTSAAAIHERNRPLGRAGHHEHGEPSQAQPITNDAVGRQEHHLRRFT